MRNISSIWLFFIFCTFSLFLYIYVVELAIYDLFTFSTWGLSIEIYKSGRLIMKPYSIAGTEWRWADHPNTYSGLFYPHICIISIYLLTRISFEYLSMVMVISYILVFYLIFKKFLKNIIYNCPRYIEIVIIGLYMLNIIVRNINYPGFSFFYISYGMLMFWYLFLTILFLKEKYYRITFFIILLFIIGTNYSYYTSIFIFFLLSLLMYLFLTIKFFKLLDDNYSRNARFIFISVSMVSITLLLLFNPLILHLHGNIKSIKDLIFDIITTILITSGSAESRRTFVYNEQFFGVINQICSSIIRMTTITFITIFIIMLIFKILKPEIILQPFYGVSLVISLILISPLLTATYTAFGQRVLHTYMLTISSVFISFYVTCMTFALKLMKRKLSRFIKATAIVLTMLMTISLLISLMNSYVININPVLPKNFHKDARNLANFIAIYVQAQNDIFISSNNAFAAQLYFRTVFTNTTTYFKYFPSEIDSISYNYSCYGTLCFYALHHSWKIMSTSLYSYNIINKSLSLIYDDGRFILINLKI